MHAQRDPTDTDHRGEPEQQQARKPGTAVCKQDPGKQKRRQGVARREAVAAEHRANQMDVGGRQDRWRTWLVEPDLDSARIQSANHRTDDHGPEDLRTAPHEQQTHNQQHTAIAEPGQPFPGLFRQRRLAGPVQELKPTVIATARQRHRNTQNDDRDRNNQQFKHPSRATADQTLVGGVHRLSQTVQGKLDTHDQSPAFPSTAISVAGGRLNTICFR